jgi:transposase
VRQARELILVLDNTPAHSRCEQVLIDFPHITLLRLAPYSPMLNPNEGAWSAIKANIKNLSSARLPQVHAPNTQGALITVALLKESFVCFNLLALFFK